MLLLVSPDVCYREQYLEMLQEWRRSGEEPAPWVLCEDCSDFAAMVQKFAGLSRGVGVPAGFVPCSTFWALDTATGKLVGAVNIRHCLNETLERAWGHIGYGVRPEERRRGRASEMLALALSECAKLGLERVLLGCYGDNIASAKTILKSGGVLENERSEPGTGRIIQRYWIEIEKPL